MNTGHKTIVAMLAIVAAETVSGGPPVPIIEYLLEEDDPDLAVNTGSLGESANGIINGATRADDCSLSLAFDGEDDFVRVPNVFDYTEQVTVEVSQSTPLWPHARSL